MANDVLSSYGLPHPAPHAGAVGTGVLFAALLASPMAWTLQLLVNYGLASHACFPREAPHPTAIPGWGWTWSASLAINLVALAVACAATVVAFRLWQRTSTEVHGDHDRLLEAGEGRTRFLAVWGIWAGVWFALSIAFNTILVFEVPLCGS
jgi:hypothetical protein